MPEIVVASLYRFVRLDEYRALREPLLDLMHKHTIRGTLLLAAEGINGTVAGGRQAIDLLVAWLKADPLLADLEYKEQIADEMPFRRAKVRLKNEIVTLGVAGIDPRETVGTYVQPEDWNALISDPDVTVIDTRNDYEVEIGSFPGAVNPNTATFREFPEFAERELDPSTHRKVAMFCTGGIRCEKSTAYLKSRGFEEVYHLKGGILNYLANVNENESLWQGECFVFDDRVTVNGRLEPGDFDQCHACRRPISDADKAHPAWEPGVSCPRCIDEKTDDQRSGFAERRRQMLLAAARGEPHLGDAATDVAAQRREEKQSARAQQRQISRHRH